MTKATAHQPVSPVRRIDTQWKKLLPAATLIIGTIGNFWDTPPPDLGGDSPKALAHFAQFIVTILIGLMVLPMMKWCCRKTHAWLWGKVAAVALIAGIVAFFAYQHLLGQWTVTHGSRVLYVGTEVRQDVKEFVQNNPSMPKYELLEYAGWDPRNVWTEKSLLHRRLILSGVYILCTPLFAIAVVAVAQLMYCAGSRE